MYQAKVPPVRPRSSLSTDARISRDSTRHLHGTNRNNTIITLVGFCVILFIFCVILLGALVYVGKVIISGHLAISRFNMSESYVVTSPYPFEINDSLRLATNPILRVRPTENKQPINNKKIHMNLSQKVMTSSKVLQQLSFRLPRQLRPRQYKLRLHPDLVNKTFSGNITIRFEVLGPISFVPLHSKFLTVSTDEVQQLGESDSPLAQLTPKLTFEHPEYEYWVTEFSEPLSIGNYSMRLSFNGSLTNRIVGLYQSSYFDSERNVQRWIATSKFEPTYARQAFPCFDEPAMKATFDITIVRPTGDGYHALSNMDVFSEEEMGELTEVRFTESVPMSTYLACFIVSDFAKKTQTVSGTLAGAKDFEMSVYATAGQIEKVNYALEIGANITEFYIDYFKIAYPLPKLDMAAIPDFVSGAMEHWGMVTFRETALLYDPTISASSNKQRVATVVAHELAHSWFGNLVTMKWWNDLWLNEGFASYIEYKGVNSVHPNWHMMDQFLIEDLHRVMKLDATLASHPIVQPVENPNQITELFDSITYSKGAAIIRMLEHLVGEDNFRKGTTNYLEKYYFNNAETKDYLTELEMLGLPFDVKLIMQTWTDQMGLPVVNVSRTVSGLKCTQMRFLSNPEDYNRAFEESQFNYRWSIPMIYYTSESSQEESVIFNYNDNELPLNVGPTVSWIVLNHEQIGYYHVNYPLDMWESLSDALIAYRFTFSVANRASLLSDSFILSGASQLPISVALNMSKYLEEETDYVPWSVGSSHLSNVKNLLYYTELYGDFVRYVRQLVSKAYVAVTWNVDNDHMTNLLRSTILNTACAFGHSDALAEAAQRFRTWLQDPITRPNADLRSTIYFYGMEVAGNEEIWDQVWDLYKAEQDAQEKIKLMEALSAIKEPWILQRFINLAWDEKNVRGQDYFTCLQYIARNRIGQSLVWDYVREQWPHMVERFGINERYLGRLIPGITNRFASQTKLEEMQAFFAKYPEAGAGTAARREAIETVKYNMKWLQENKQQVAEWLGELEMMKKQ